MTILEYVSLTRKGTNVFWIIDNCYAAHSYIGTGVHYQDSNGRPVSFSEMSLGANSPIASTLTEAG
jgi:hypothetical protein